MSSQAEAMRLRSFLNRLAVGLAAALLGPSIVGVILIYAGISESIITPLVLGEFLGGIAALARLLGLSGRKSRETPVSDPPQQSPEETT